jgi:hypothetical protein
MRYLRMLTNSAVGGLIVAAYLTVLVLHLNPGLGLHPSRSFPLFLTMALFYGVHAAVLFYVLIVVRQLLAVEVLSPGWLSVRLLVWLLAGASSLGAALMWMNLASFRAALDPRIAERMTAGAAVLTACAALLGALACLHYSFGRRGSRLSAMGLAVLAAGSFIGPLAARGPAIDEDHDVAPAATAGHPPADASPRVTLLLLDGASLEFIAPAVAEGRLPNFGRILDAGAAMHLETLRPTQPAPVWTAVATGKLPHKHGIRSEATYAFRGGRRPIARLPDYCYAQALVRFGFLREAPYTSADIRTRPLWDILSGSSMSVGVVGWPLTFPARPVHGYIVSEEFARVADERIALRGDPAIVYPEPLLPLALAARGTAATLSSAAPVAAAASWPAGDGGRDTVAAPLAADMATERVAAAFANARPARVTAVRYAGLDTVGHRYLRYTMPDAFGDVSDEDRRRYGRVLEQYYAYVDGIIGRATGAMAPGDLLLVVSGFGMEPLGPGKRLLELAFGTPSLSGTHEDAPDGFLIAYGESVAPGRPVRGSVLDVTPTLLYFLGLPLARDMDGYARPDLFSTAFTTARPLTFIPSYDR